MSTSSSKTKSNHQHPDAGPHSLTRWRSYSGVSWETSKDGSDPAPFKDSANSPINGIHFDKQGRAFVSNARFITSKTPATLSILDTNSQSGPARLTAFPSVEENSVEGAPADHLRSVLGFSVDNYNGWLWALDQGYVAGEAESPPGAQKVVIYSLATGEVIKRIPLDGAADRKGSFLNDIAVDERRRIAFIADSGLRSAPDVSAGIIVINFASGNARRVLHKHSSVDAEPGVKVICRGAEIWPGSPMKLGVNGIALSPDASTLYWTITTGLRAHAIPTDILRDPNSSDESIAAAVRDIGNVGGNTDGIVTDAAGNLYITDVTRSGIVKFDPHSREMALIASSDGVHWPDTATITPDGDLVFSSSNLHDHFAGAIKPGNELFELWRLRLGDR